MLSLAATSFRIPLAPFGSPTVTINHVSAVGRLAFSARCRRLAIRGISGSVRVVTGRGPGGAPASAPAAGGGAHTPGGGEGRGEGGTQAMTPATGGGWEGVGEAPATTPDAGGGGGGDTSPGIVL